MGGSDTGRQSRAHQAVARTQGMAKHGNPPAQRPQLAPVRVRVVDELGEVRGLQALLTPTAFGKHTGHDALVLLRAAAAGDAPHVSQVQVGTAGYPGRYLT